MQLHLWMYSPVMGERRLWLEEETAGQAALFLAEGKARSHAEKVRWFDQEYVSLFDSPNQRALYDCTLAKHQDLDIGRRQTSWIFSGKIIKQGKLRSIRLAMYLS